MYHGDILTALTVVGACKSDRYQEKSTDQALNCHEQAAINGIYTCLLVKIMFASWLLAASVLVNHQQQA